jgi:hypothetical protein
MPMFRRRPLLRAAAVGGGAYMAGKHHANSQAAEASQDQQIADLQAQQQYAQPAPAPVAAPPAPAPSMGVTADTIQRLEDLGKLHEQGILTDDEFAQQKQRLLAG